MAVRIVDLHMYLEKRRGMLNCRDKSCHLANRAAVGGREHLVVATFSTGLGIWLDTGTLLDVIKNEIPSFHTDLYSLLWNPIPQMVRPFECIPTSQTRDACLFFIGGSA
jgi:hypothetical protein